MRRSSVSLADVADWHNLARAFHRAAKGKRGRPDVERFRAGLDRELARLRSAILDGIIQLGRTRRFTIRDPKPRVIHAPAFEERVLHHALMAEMGPILDRTLVADTFACREGKGTLAAVRRAQQHLRRQPWYAQIDIRRYFASIDHAVLLGQIGRRFKDRGLLGLVERIVRSHEYAPGKGLPIGALTSQHFANAYLGEVDRLLLEQCRVAGYVRYMDDSIWWDQDRAAVRRALQFVREHLESRLRLTIKEPVRVGRSRDGLSFSRYRIRPNRLLLSRRRKRRYAERRQAWERAYLDDRIDGRTLQAGYTSALAITAHADAAAWRREQLHRHGLEPALHEV